MIENRIANLDSVRSIVGAPEHRAAARDIARRAITLARDPTGVVPLAVPAGTTNDAPTVVLYLPETEIRAGRAFSARLRGVWPKAAIHRIGPTTPTATLDAIGARANGPVVIATYVRRMEGEGRASLPAHTTSWIRGLASARVVVGVAFGNPYVIRAFPSVAAYLVTYGITDDLEVAAADALAGAQPITGRLPIGIPGLLSRGAGVQRAPR